MHLTFKTITNKRYELDVPENASIQGIKDGLSTMYHFAKDQILLIYHSKVLSDNDHIVDVFNDQSPEILLHIHKRIPPPKPPKVTIYSPIKNYVPSPHVTASPLLPEIALDDMGKNANNEDSSDSPISSPKATLPIDEPLPSLFQTKFDDPENFDEQVLELVNLGFSKEDSQYALRSALYNLERAANYLLSGSIPDPIEISNRQIDTDDKEELDKLDQEPYEFFDDDNDNNETPQISVNQVKNFLKEHPENLGQFFSVLSQFNPDVAFILKNNPERFIANIGLNPQDFDFSIFKEKSEYEKQMDQLSSEEQEAIKRLEQIGLDTMTTIQVYIACDKDEQAASDCLKSMK